MSSTTTTTTETTPQNPNNLSVNPLPLTAPPSSATTNQIHRGPVTATLNFYTPPADGSKPYNWVCAPPPGSPSFNFGSESIPVSISDMRGHESSFSLSKNAFATLSHISSEEKEFASDADIESVYYPEVSQLLLDHVPGAQRIVLFDHTIRRANPTASRAPVTRVHIDQTPASAADRVRLHCPDDAETLLKGRYRIVNVWRPINGAVESFPLAVADSGTVREEDLVGIEHRYEERTGETAGVRFGEGMRWWYWSGMADQERLLLQCFDSWDLGARVPHTAFVDPRSGEAAKARESIEVRALVFG